MKLPSPVGHLIRIVSTILLTIILLCALGGAFGDQASDLWWQSGLWVLLGCLVFAVMPTPALRPASGMVLVPKSQSPPSS